MKTKLLIIALISTFLFGCGDSTMRDGNIIITRIEEGSINDFDEDGEWVKFINGCYYYGKGAQGKGWFLNKGEFVFYSEKGKFNIGDTVKLSK